MRVLGFCLTIALLCLTPKGVVAQEGTLTLSGDPQSLVVRTAAAGFAPDPASDESSVYSLVVSQTASVTARLDAPLPQGVELLVRLEPPAGSLGNGYVLLSTTSQTLVSSIPAGTHTGLTVSYLLRATVSAGVVSSSLRQVHFTVVVQ